MVDFEAKRVLDLFKDEDKSELKEGITTRDINSIASMTPTNRQELQEDLQKAYRLIYDKSNAEMGKVAEMPQLPSSTIQSQTSLGKVPSVSQALQQPQPQQSNNSESKTNPMAEQFLDMYNKIKDEKVAANKQPQIQQPINQLSSYQDYVEKIKELENLSIEKDKEIELLKKEKDELINQQYELENKHLEKYKELNNKYEDLKEEASNNNSQKDDSLVDYLKEANARLEQKQGLLLQEIGKLKGMLGI